MLECYLPDKLIQLQDYSAIQRFPLVFCPCGWEIDSLVKLILCFDKLSEFLVRFLSTVVFQPGFGFPTSDLPEQCAAAESHFSPVDLRPSFGSESSATYIWVVHMQISPLV